MGRGRHISNLDKNALTRLDRILLPILRRWPGNDRWWQALWQAVAQKRVRSQHNPRVPVSTNHIESWFGCFKPWTRLARGLKTEDGTHRFVGLMARGMA